MINSGDNAPRDTSTISEIFANLCKHGRTQFHRTLLQVGVQQEKLILAIEQEQGLMMAMQQEQ